MARSLGFCRVGFCREAWTVDCPRRMNLRELPVIELTEEQEDEAAAIQDILAVKARVTAKYLARLMASKGNRQLFGETEFFCRMRCIGWVRWGWMRRSKDRKKGVQRQSHQLSGLWKRRPIRELLGLRSAANNIQRSRLPFLE